MDEVEVKPPYGAGDVGAQEGVDARAVNRVKMIVEATQ